MNGAEAMVECLKKEGVSVVFGYPGAAICPFYNALSISPIRHILVRQEQNAGHAASGYARISGKPGVCVVTSGPGATNVITAVASAYMDSIPVVIITGQVSSELLGRDVFQEVDITGATEPFTKHSYLVKNVEDIPRVFREAFHIASTGRPGPVLIDMPVDIQQKQISRFEYPDSVNIAGYKPSTRGHAVQVKRALAAIEKSKRPVICAGGGVFSSRSQKVLRRFAEKTQIPVVTTMMGIGALPSDYPLNLGMLGSHGTKPANTIIRETDLLILCGARVGDRAMSRPGQIAEHATIIHIDIDPAEIGKNMPAHIPIVGDLKNILTHFEEETAYHAGPEWTGRAIELKGLPAAETSPVSGYIDPKRFMELLSAAAPDDTVLVADVGQNQIWSANHFAVRSGRFLTSGGMGTMGYSVSAAYGAKLAAPSKTAIAVCGDGSFQMQQMELATICQHHIDVKIIVMSNNRLGMVRELQKNLYDNNLFGVSLDGSPDFIKLAEAYGIPSERISHMEEADGAIRRLLSARGVSLLECVVNPEESSL